MEGEGSNYGGLSEAVSQLQNIARNLALQAQSQVNAYPIPTTTVSPRFTAVQLSTAATAVIGTSALRHGMMFHNPGTTSVYLYQTGMTSAPTTSNIAGSILMAPGATITLPSTEFPNLNAGFSAFATTGSSQAFTVIEFF